MLLKTYSKKPAGGYFQISGQTDYRAWDQNRHQCLANEADADKILEWLKREINEAWENRDNIQPSFEGAPKPKVIEILKLLPRTNCRDCGMLIGCYQFRSLFHCLCGDPDVIGRNWRPLLSEFNGDP